MSADKRSVSTDALETLGTIIGDGENRDAIHLGVEPIEAAMQLNPGQHIGIQKDGKARGAHSTIKLVGIVDPFLTAPVKKGQRFWLVVYPRQITSLRHVWTHPDFPESDEVPVVKDVVQVSKEWIENFCASIPLDYATVMQGAEDWLESKRNDGWGEYLCFGGLLEGESVPEEFWDHYSIVTGDNVNEKHRGSFFTCSC